MSRISKLTRDQKQWLEGLIQGAINGAKVVSTSNITAEVHGRIERLQIDGDYEAEEIARALVEDGVRARVESVLSKIKSTLLYAEDGRPLTVNTYQAVAVRASPDDVDQRVYYQKQMFVEMSTDDFLAFVAAANARVRNLMVQLEGWRKIEAIVRSYPEATTVREALEYAGVDPDTLEITPEQFRSLGLAG